MKIIWYIKVAGPRKEFHGIFLLFEKAWKRNGPVEKAFFLTAIQYDISNLQALAESSIVFFFFFLKKNESEMAVLWSADLKVGKLQIYTNKFCKFLHMHSVLYVALKCRELSLIPFQSFIKKLWTLHKNLNTR